MLSQKNIPMENNLNPYLTHYSKKENSRCTVDFNMKNKTNFFVKKDNILMIWGGKRFQNKIGKALGIK